jgi:hypothetical protein
MTTSSYGANSRQPVFSGNRRVPGLYARRLADGATVFEVKARLGGKVQRHRLQASTKTDAIAELRALQTDYARGEQGRSPSAALTVSELAADWLTHLDARIDHRDPRRRYSARTVDKYRQRVTQHILPAFGHRGVAAVTLADLRRLIDKLGRAGLAPATVTSVINITSGLFRFGVKSGALERNIVRDLDRDDRPGVARQSEPRYLSIDELELLLARMGDTFRPVAAVCALRACDSPRRSGSSGGTSTSRRDDHRHGAARRERRTCAAQDGRFTRDGPHAAGARRRAPRAPFEGRRAGARAGAPGCVRIHDLATQAARPPKRAPGRLRRW